MIKEGIYSDININDYHLYKDWYSSTGLRKAKKSLKDFYLYLNGYYDHEKKSFFDFGNAFELALLDKESFVANVNIFNEKDRPEQGKTFASSLNKAWKEDFFNTDNYVINQDGGESYRVIEEMLKSCYADAVIRKLIENIEYQYSMFWIDSHGLKLKTRPDICKSKKNIIVDVKTTRDGSPEAFSKDIANHDYPFQACMQIDGVLSTGFMKTVDEYYWLVVEKEPPFSATLYKFEQEDIKYCMDEYDYTKHLVAECLKTNIWPSYSQRADNKWGILSAKIPLWYRNYGL